MTDCFVARANAQTLPITSLTETQLDDWLKTQSKETAAWVKASAFTAAAGSVLLLPDSKKGAAGVLAGIEGDDDIWRIVAFLKAAGKQC